MNDWKYRILAALAVATASFVMASDDGPVPVELIEDADRPGCYEGGGFAAYQSYGKYRPLEPDIESPYDLIYNKMSVDEAMTRITDLARNEHPFATEEDVVARCIELVCLSSIVALCDTGGTARIRATCHLMSKYGEFGGSPLDLEHMEPLKRGPQFGASPGLKAARLNNYDLSAASAEFLAKTFRTQYERAISGPESGLTFRFQKPGSSAVYERFYVSLMRSILKSGFATPDFASWLSDRYIEQLHDALTKSDIQPILYAPSLRLLEHAGALERKQLQRLLHVATGALFLAPNDRRHAIVTLLGEVANLSIFVRDDAVQVLDVLQVAQNLDAGWSRHSRWIVKPFVERFGMATLYAVGPPPEIVTSYIEWRDRRRDRAESVRPSPTPVHLRQSNIRFPFEGEPRVVAVTARSITATTWQVLRCGSEQSAGTLSVRLDDGVIHWSFLSGSRPSKQGRVRLTGENPIVRIPLKSRSYVKAWASPYQPIEMPTFDIHFLELSLEPLAEDGLTRPALFQMLADAVSRDPALTRAALGWLEQRSDDEARDVLVSICKRDDRQTNETAIQAAKVLIERDELDVFDGMIPELLDVQMCMPTPLLKAFHALANDDRVGENPKRRWAAAMIRQHVNGPVPGWAAMAVMTVVTHLSGESFGFEQAKSAKANLPAFTEAQQWAWRQ